MAVASSRWRPLCPTRVGRSERGLDAPHLAREVARRLRGEEQADSHGHPPEELRRRGRIAERGERVMDERVFDDVDRHRFTIQSSAGHGKTSERTEGTEGTVTFTNGATEQRRTNGGARMPCCMLGGAAPAFRRRRVAERDGGHKQPTPPTACAHRHARPPDRAKRGRTPICDGGTARCLQCTRCCTTLSGLLRSSSVDSVAPFVNLRSFRSLPGMASGLIESANR